MYRINKRTEAPESFQNWLNDNDDRLQIQYEDVNISGTQMWTEHTDLPEFPKPDLRKALLEDQGYVCCYCGFPVTNDGMSCVIEHFRPKKEYKKLVFDYTNLFASCKGSSKNHIHIIEEGETIESIANKFSIPLEYLVGINNGIQSLDGLKTMRIKNGTKVNEQHCDILKGGNELFAVDLLNPEGFSEIYYSSDGEVLSGNEHIIKDIKTLGLNNNFELSYLRLLSFEHALNLYRRIRELEPEILAETFVKLKEKYSRKDNETLKFKPFYFIYLWIWKN